MIVVELRCQRLQGTFHNAAVIDGKINAIEQVGTVAAVGQDRLRPAPGRQCLADHLGFGDGSIMLGVRRGDPCRPDRVDVNQQPTPGNDIAVGTERFLVDRHVPG